MKRLLTVALSLALGSASAGLDRRALVDFLSLPSRSHDLPQLVRGIDFLKDWLTARGVCCTVETNVCGYVGLYAATTPGKVHDYMFVGHVDVVDAPDAMFRPRIEGDRIFARGACDTKGNVMVMCQVLANLVGKASVGMFVATDEEGGGAGTATPQMISIMKALKRATPEGQEVPYVIDPFFPRRPVLAERNLPDDGRAIWNDSWTESCVKMGSADDDWRGGGDAVGTTFSSFDAIDMIFAKLGDRRLYPNLRRVVLTGFSAGGQFVGRYVAVGKGRIRDGVTLEYAAMSPSTEFRFERDDPWLYGLKGRPRYSAKLTEAQILANLSSRHVRRACGTLDNQVGAQYAVDGTPPALAQGRSRYERFVNFEKYLKDYPDWARQVTFHPMEGLGHDSSVAHRLPGFIDYVLGKGDK